MSSMLLDVRLALRGLEKNPVFTATVLITLGLGLGATVAMWSVVDGVLLRPLPYSEPDRLVQVWSQFPEMNAYEFPVSPAEYVDYRDESQLFEHLAAFTQQPVTITGDGDPERIQAVAATASFWKVLRVEAARGRVFDAEDDQPGRDRGVVIGHGLWQRRFGGDPSIIGRTLVFDGVSHIVLGVLPASFGYPSSEVQAWAPLQLDESAITSRYHHHLQVLGRLAPEASLGQVSPEMQRVVSRWEEQHDHAHPLHGVGLADQLLGETRSPLFLLLGATALVLLIASVNVAGLLLARGESRRRELGLRSALGAGRHRLVGPVLVESTLLGLGGGVLGLGIAALCLRALQHLEPGDLPRLDQVGLDERAFAVALGLSLLVGTLCGVLPALRASGTNLSAALRAGGQRVASGLRQQRVRSLLVVTEIALAVFLVTSAGLLLRSLDQLQQSDTGMDAENVLRASLSLPNMAYPGADEVSSFYRLLEDELGSLPGVSEASLVNFQPFGGAARMENFYVEGRPRAEDDEGMGTDVMMVSKNYFSTLGIPLVRGRGFTDADRGDSSRVLILGESLARTVFPDENPIGQRLLVRAARPEEPAFEIVGVVADVQYFGALEGVRPQIYLPLAQGVHQIIGVTRTVTTLLKGSAATEVFAGQLRQRLHELDPDLAIAEVGSLETAYQATLARPRFTTALLGTFGSVALVLAAVGLYGLLAYLVGLRWKELGIRSALGASRGDLSTLLTRQGMGLTAAGLALGLLGTLLAAGLLERFLFQTEPTNLRVFATSAAVMALTTLLASWLPARRAASVDPALVLRAE